MFYNHEKNRASWQFFAFIAVGSIITIGIIIFVSVLSSQRGGANSDKQVLSAKIEDESVMSGEYFEAVNEFKNKINQADYNPVNLTDDAEVFFLQTTVPTSYLDEHLAAFIKFNETKDGAGLDHSALLSVLSEIMGDLTVVK
jgi:hypothetical protein